jgi:hypothetical protein
MGQWRYGSTILDLGTRWRYMFSFTPRPLYLRGKCPRYPLYRRLGGPQSQSGRCGVEKNLLPMPGIEPRPSSPRSSLYRLSYPGSQINDNTSDMSVYRHNTIPLCDREIIRVIQLDKQIWIQEETVMWDFVRPSQHPFDTKVTISEYVCVSRFTPACHMSRPP